MNIFRFIVLICVLACALSCATIGAEENVQNATVHYKMGVADLNENKIQQAYVEFFKANELDPKNKEVLNAIGILFMMHLDEPAKAIDYFDKATRIDPSYSDAYNNLGYAYEKTGNFEKAIIFYRKALVNPLYLTAEKAYMNISSSYYRMGKYEEAMAAIKEAIKREPGLGLAYMKLALCYNALGKYGDASTAMTHAIDLDPVYKGNREKAREDLNLRKLSTTGYEEQDFRDYLEILKY